jgi:hypothetical protein
MFAFSEFGGKGDREENKPVCHYVCKPLAAKKEETNYKWKHGVSP